MANPPTIDQIGGIDTVVSSLPDDNKVTGTTAPGSSVTLFFNDSPLGTAQVEVSGSWSYFLGKDNITTLGQGVSETITAKATDAGGTSAQATSAPFSVDNASPFTPISSIGGDGVVSGQQGDASVIGTTEPGSSVTLFFNGAPLGTATVDVSGGWTYPLTPGNITTIGQGAGKTITAIGTDAVGNAVPVEFAQSVIFTVDTIPPAVPTALVLATGSDSGSSSSDGITNVTTPTITGTGGEAGATVTLRDGAATIGTGTVAAGGGWSITATKALAEGANSITATQTDVAGNTSGPSAALGVTLDTTAAAPTALALSPASDSGAQGDDITNVALPTITGTGEAGATVTLRDGATTIGTGAVAAGGGWSVAATTALAEGANSITATQTDVAGNISGASAALNVTLDTTAPAATSTPDLLAASDSGTSNADDITNVVLPTITGTGEVGATVTLLDGATTIGTGTVAADGGWSITATTALTEGANTITATQTDAAGNTSGASAALDVTLDTTAAAPTALALTTASDSGNSSTDNITDVVLPTITGTGEAGATVTLRDGAATIGTGTVAADGGWSITATTALTEGANTITATQTDVAGNTSGPSGPLAVTIDTAGPAVTAVTGSPSDAVVGPNAVVALTLGLSEPATVDTTGGVPTLALNNGGTASYVSGSGTAALIFDYTVGAGQDVSDLAVTAVDPNGATVTDQAGNAADLTGAVMNPAGTLSIESIAAFDATSGRPVGVVGQAYTGPVADLQSEYINITSDNLNISMGTPNWFIHTGSGDDAIAASSGTNVLDGGTGSNFLTGGSGSDTFFVDNRGASADTWSTIVNFGVGDAVTIWGVTPNDFNFDFEDGQGATGFTGLTLHATAPDKPTASVTFAGFTTADLANGRISESSGTEPVSGSEYTYFHANG